MFKFTDNDPRALIHSHCFPVLLKQMAQLSPLRCFDVNCYSINGQTRYPSHLCWRLISSVNHFNYGHKYLFSNLDSENTQDTRPSSPTSRSLHFVVLGFVTRSHIHKHVLDKSAAVVRTRSLPFWTRKVPETLRQLAVTLTQLMRTRIASIVASVAWNTIGCSPVAFPFEGNKVGKVVLKIHAGGGGVTQIVHLATFVNSVHSSTRSQKAAITTVALVGERITPCGTPHHLPQFNGSSFASLVFGYSHKVLSTFYGGLMAGTIGELGKNRITEETEVGTMIEIVDRFRIRTLYVTNKRGHCGVLMAF